MINSSPANSMSGDVYVSRLVMIQYWRDNQHTRAVSEGEESCPARGSILFSQLRTRGLAQTAQASVRVSLVMSHTLGCRLSLRIPPTHPQIGSTLSLACGMKLTVEAAHATQQQADVTV